MDVHSQAAAVERAHRMANKTKAEVQAITDKLCVLLIPANAESDSVACEFTNRELALLWTIITEVLNDG